jgi:CO/xanthine dehydrogenase FAD-binding subunit
MLGAREAKTPDYARPEDLAEALRLRGQGSAIIAGGTDFYPVRVGRPLRGPETGILDLTGIAALRGFSDEGDSHRIGALTSWTEIAESVLPAHFNCLQAAAREVGGRQIQNRGTIGGNLCNASPAADGVPALLALGAEVELLSEAGARRLQLAEFIVGPRRTALRDDEILAAILVPRPQGEAISAFHKLGARRYLVISIVMAAGWLDIVDGRIAAARIAIGACSPVAQRLPKLEAELRGRAAGSDLAKLAHAGQLDGLAPIDDVRASAEYRREAALTVLKRLLVELTP